MRLRLVGPKLIFVLQNTGKQKLLGKELLPKSK